MACARMELQGVQYDSVHGNDLCLREIIMVFSG